MDDDKEDSSSLDESFHRTFSNCSSTTTPSNSSSSISSGDTSIDEEETASVHSHQNMDRRGGRRNADDESIDTLYKAMEMAEPLPGIVLQRERSKNNGAHPTSIAAVDPTGNPSVNGTMTVATQQEQQLDEDERAFIWVLLEFARKRCWKKKILTICIIVSSVYVLTDIMFLGNVVPLVNDFLEWMTQNTVWAVIACILFFAAATLVFVPHAILTCGAGWAFSNVLGFGFGLIVALFVSFMGSALGAILSFIRSRYMMRDLVELFAARFPIVRAVDRALERKGFKIMLLLRLCPIIPFNGLNYIGGVTSVSLEEYTQALVGILPITLLWSSVGASADQITDRTADGYGEQLLLILLLFFGVLCGLAGLARIYRYARDELKREIECDRVESWRKYKKSTSSGLDMGDSNSRRGLHQVDTSDVNEGIEVLNKADLTWLAVLGIDINNIEAQYPLNPDGDESKDDEPLWYWA